MNKPFLQQLYDSKIFPAEQIVPKQPEEHNL
mgnify:CR=1 FL=1